MTIEKKSSQDLLIAAIERACTDCHIRDNCNLCSSECHVLGAALMRLMREETTNIRKWLFK